MGDDSDNKLQREISLGGEITPQGISGNAKLRWESCQKGLWGGIIARYNAR